MHSANNAVIRAADVARAVGNSISAVSRAFRPDSPISPDLRDKILLSARELGYVSPQIKAAAQMSSAGSR